MPASTFREPRSPQPHHRTGAGYAEDANKSPASIDREPADVEHKAPAGENSSVERPTPEPAEPPLFEEEE